MVLLRLLHRITIDWAANKQETLISHSSGGWRAEIRVPARAGSGEDALCGLQAATFSLWPHVAERR